MFTVISMNNEVGRNRYQKFMGQLSEGDQLKFNKLTGMKVKMRKSAWDYSKKQEGRIGCTKSHKKASNLDTTVFEDDSLITGDLDCWLNNIIPFCEKNKVDVLYGSCAVKAPIKKANIYPIEGCSCQQKHYAVECNAACCLFMYKLLSKKAKKTMQTAPDKSIIDSWFAGQTHGKKMKCFFIVPFLAKTTVGVSNIHGKYMNCTKGVESAEKRFKTLVSDRKN